MKKKTTRVNIGKGTSINPTPKKIHKLNMEATNRKKEEKKEEEKMPSKKFTIKTERINTIKTNFIIRQPTKAT